MNEIFAILFGLPSFLILFLLFYVGTVHTIVSVYHAIKNKDYDYLFLFISLTLCSAMVGWSIGDFI